MKDLHQALFNLSLELPAFKKDKAAFNYKYVPLDSIMETVGPLLAKHELLWLTGPSIQDGEPTLAYELVHLPSGDSLKGEMLLMLDKSNPQGQGSALTYARRYSITAILNLIAEDDDDGKAASPAPKSAPKTAQTFAQKVKKAGVDANSIRMYLSAKDFVIGDDVKLADYLNDLSPAQQKELLEWANGT